MKFYKYSLIAALALSGALSACSDDIDYTPGAPVSGDEVFFPLTQSEAVGIPFEATSVDIDVNRLVADNAITVPVAAVITDSEGEDATDIFTVPSQVSFAAGEKSTELTIGVDFSKVVAEEDYLITLTLEGDNTTPYGASTRTYTLAFSPWSEWKDVKGQTGVYTDSFFEPGEYEVLVQTCNSTIDNTRFKYAVCDANWFFYKGDERREDDDDPIRDIEYTFDTTNYIEVDGVKCPIVSMNIVTTNYTNGGEFMIFTDIRSYITEIIGWDGARADAYMESRGWGQSYFNPETGTFFIDVVWFTDSGMWSPAYDYLQLPGYKSYVLNFDYTGNFVDPYTEIEYAIVNAYKSEDVTSYVYDIFAGELEGNDLETAYADVKGNKELEAQTAGTTNLAFTLEEDGAYTVVAVGLDEEDEEVCKQAYSFNYKSVQGAPVEKWNSIGYCEYTDVLMPFFFGLDYDIFDVEIQESEETPGLYRLVDPYKDIAEAYSRAGMTYASGKHYITVNATNPERVYIITSELGIGYPDYGQLLLTSEAYLNLGDYSEDLIAQVGLFGKLEDGEITFPTATLLTTGEKLSSWYYANTDPDNPTLDEDYEGKPDPTLGENPFSIVLPDAASAAPAKSKKLEPINYLSAKSLKKFESNFKVNKSAKSLKTIDAKALKEYRLANPIRIN